jgi:hypothetical protein
MYTNIQNLEIAINLIYKLSMANYQMTTADFYNSILKVHFKDYEFKQVGEHWVITSEIK